MVIVPIYSLIKKICNFKANNKNVNFPTQFCVGNMSEIFVYVKYEEASFKRNAYDFSVYLMLLINLKF